MKLVLIASLIFPFSLIEAEDTTQKQSLPFQWEGHYYYRSEIKLELCHYTVCEEDPRCSRSGGWLEMFTDRSGEECGTGETRKYCCKEGQLPRCLKTPCSSIEWECPSDYRVMDFDRYSCGGTMGNLYCCRNDYAPPCFNTSCSMEGEKCLKDYFVTRTIREGCPSGREKRTCCTHSNEQLRTHGLLVNRKDNFLGPMEESGKKESVVLEIKQNAPSSAFCQYVGDLVFILSLSLGCMLLI